MTGPLSLKSDVDVAQGGGFLCDGHNDDVNAVVLAKNGALASGSAMLTAPPCPVCPGVPSIGLAW